MGARRALITGATGQDGTYLKEILLRKGYEVLGTSRTAQDRVKSELEGSNYQLREIDLCNFARVRELVDEFQPDEVYNLAARSSSSQLFDDPVATTEVNGLVVVHLLESIREVSPHTRFCQAASSEVFAGAVTCPQDENTPYRPINAYGAAKAFAANIAHAYKVRFDLFTTTAILFNHESPFRNLDYVTRKITHTVAKITLGKVQHLTIGSLDSRRDWGFAGDYARAMWMMMQQTEPEDYVVATGVTHTVREFCEIAFSHVGLDYVDFVRIDPRWHDKRETVELCGDPKKITKNLGWRPSVSFRDLVHMMVDADLERVKIDLDSN